VGEQGSRATLGALVGRGLVDPDGSGRFSVHPVLSMQARSLLRHAPDGGHEARLLHATHYLGVLRSAGALYNAGSDEARRVGLGLFDSEWENVRAGQFWAASRLAEAREDSRAARLVSSYAGEEWRLLIMRATVEEQYRWLTDALEADQVLIDASLLEGAREDQEEVQGTHLSARAHHLHLLAEVQRQVRQTDEAFALEREAGEIYHSLGDSRRESQALNGLGSLYRVREEYELAEQNYLRAIELLDASVNAQGGTGTRGGPDVDRAAVLGNLGILYRHMGRTEPAEEAIGEAIPIFRALGDMVQVGTALDNRGALRSAQGDKAGARRDFLTARRIFRALGSRNDEAISTLGLGREHENAGEHRRAEQRAREVIAACRELGNLHLEVWASALLADARLGLGYPAEAERIYREVLHAARGAQDKRLESMALSGLDKAARAQRDH
jgi:tetratricopeptide (TPR) repeat protein